MCWSRHFKQCLCIDIYIQRLDNSENARYIDNNRMEDATRQELRFDCPKGKQSMNHLGESRITGRRTEIAREREREREKHGF